MSLHDVHDDQQPQEDTELLAPRDTPPTPPSPDEQDSDTKASRKREREVSLEPATPKWLIINVDFDSVLPQADESAPEDTKERRTPAPKKKGRVNLEPTKEEDETPPESPTKASADLSTSPRYESKVRQISRKVRGMKWDDKDKPAPEFNQDSTNISEDVELRDENSQLEPPVEIVQNKEIGAMTPNEPASAQEETRTPPPDDASALQSSKEEAPPPTTTSEAGESGPSDSDGQGQDKGLKRKIADRQPSASLEEEPAKSSTKVGTEVSKRARDDNEEDDNPRERKRPTPPPEEQEEGVAESVEQTVTPPKTPPQSSSEPVAPQPKVGGFLAYASSSSPFAYAKGPSIFGQKSTPSPTPLAGTSNGSASSLSAALGMKPSSPFAIPIGNKANSSSKAVFGSPSAFSSNHATPPNNLSTSPTGTKRSGFEAFASPSSPFAAAARSKSPTGGLGLARSKSPTRRSAGNAVAAFKAYAGSKSQSFAAPSPPVKKQRQDSGDEEEKADSGNAQNATSNGVTSEESDDEPTFADRLRTEHNESDDGSKENEKPIVTEQEVHTGEEQEDTVFQVRGKLYALSEQNAWKERGTGLLKINVRKSDGSGARLVMRKEAVFTLLLNVPLFKGMRCMIAQDPRYVRFSCIESGKTVHYNLRLQNAKVAEELIDEIKANIPSDEPDDDSV